jgi:hypothetical protein
VRRLVVVALVLLLAFAVQAAASVRTVDRGLVVRVRPRAIVLRELDGSRVRIAVSPRTVVVLDGRPATLAELKRGDVAYVVHLGARPAVRIRAFSR